MNNLRGLLYEKQIKSHIVNKLNKKAYLWSETPEELLIRAGIIGSHNEHRLHRKMIFDEQKGKRTMTHGLMDTGVDIIQEEVDGDIPCSLIQCKNGYNQGVTINNLAGFNAHMAALPHLLGVVYYTNKLSQNVRCLMCAQSENFIYQATFCRNR